ncbi:MAG: acyl-CoA dehydrogenase family protein, partial [Actinomycetota bacterium]
MDFEWSEQERGFQREVRDFVAESSSPEVMDLTREGMAQLVDTPARREFMGKLADRGWLGMSWPKTYGGGEQPGIYEYLLNEE